MEQVSEHIHAETSYQGTNVGLIVTDRGLVMIESPYMPADAVDFRKKIMEISESASLTSDVAYIINTDHHGDHVACDTLFSPNMVLQELSAAEMAVTLEQLQMMWRRLLNENPIPEVKTAIEQLEPPSPHITFSDKIVFDMGNLTIEVVHVGGHAVGTSYVFVPEEKVVFTGDDVVNGRYPYMGQGSYRDWAAALRRTLDLDAEKIVPGHEAVCDKGPARALLQFMEDIQLRGRELIDEVGEHGLEGKDDRDLAKCFPHIDGYPEAAEATAAEVVRRMYAQLI